MQALIPVSKRSVVTVIFSVVSFEEVLYACLSAGLELGMDNRRGVSVRHMLRSNDGHAIRHLRLQCPSSYHTLAFRIPDDILPEPLYVEGRGKGHAKLLRETVTIQCVLRFTEPVLKLKNQVRLGTVRNV